MLIVAADTAVGLGARLGVAGPAGLSGIGRDGLEPLGVTPQAAALDRHMGLVDREGVDGELVLADHGCTQPSPLVGAGGQQGLVGVALVAADAAHLRRRRRRELAAVVLAMTIKTREPRRRMALGGRLSMTAGARGVLHGPALMAGHAGDVLVEHRSVAM